MKSEYQSEINGLPVTIVLTTYGSGGGVYTPPDDPSVPEEAVQPMKERFVHKWIGAIVLIGLAAMAVAAITRSTLSRGAPWAGRYESPFPIPTRSKKMSMTGDKKWNDGVAEKMAADKRRKGGLPLSLKETAARIVAAGLAVEPKPE